MENTKINQLTTQTQTTYKTALVKQTETYTRMLTESLGEMNIDFSNYQKICVINCIQKMKEMLTKEGLDFSQIDQSNITSILTQVSMLQLNISASPRECYLQFRNVKMKVNGEEQWKKVFEFGIEGDGNDAILRRYGVGVKNLRGAFVVREGDEFTFPYFDGEKIVAPTWKPVSYHKKPIKVFYIVDKEDGTKEYLISEREEVVKNIQAHISNNIMKEKEDVKNQIMEKISNMSLDEILDDKSLSKYISPAWTNPQSRNDMILRKMKNNATKKFPKDFKNAFIESSYEKTFEDYDQYREPKQDINPIDAVDVEIEENASKKPITTPLKETSIKSSSKEETNANEPKINENGEVLFKEELPY